MTTISFPLLSGRRATCSAAQIAAPDEIPDQEPFLAGNPAGGGEGIVVGHAHDLVVDLGVEHFRHETGADALDRVRPLGAAGEYGRGVGLDRDQAQLGLALLENLADAGDRPARTDTGHDDVHLAVGIAPDLLGGRAPVHLGVGRILELLRDEVARIGRGHLLGAADRSGHSLGPGRQHELGAVGAEQHPALAAHRLGHHQRAPVAARGAHQRQRDPGVAAGRLERDRVRPDQVLALGGVDHRDADPVLDAPARVEELELGNDLGATFLGDPPQANERSVPHQLGDVVGDFHCVPLAYELSHDNLTSFSIVALRSIPTLRAISNRPPANPATECIYPPPFETTRTGRFRADAEESPAPSGRRQSAIWSRTRARLSRARK